MILRFRIPGKPPNPRGGKSEKSGNPNYASFYDRIVTQVVKVMVILFFKAEIQAACGPRVGWGADLEEEIRYLLSLF